MEEKEEAWVRDGGSYEEAVGIGPEEEARDGGIASVEEEEVQYSSVGPEEGAWYGGIDPEEEEEAKDCGGGLEEEEARDGGSVGSLS